MTRGALVGVLVFLSLAAAGYWAWRSLVRGGEQIRNLELAKVYGRALEEYKVKNGHYPSGLAEVFPSLVNPGRQPGFDWWGHPLYYEAHSDGYVLVSCGHDGVHDGIDYGAYRSRFTSARSYESICGRWDADQILTDAGFARACGK